MKPEDIQKLRSLTTFEALVDYLRDELDWPIEAENVDELTFDYRAEELGLDPQHKVKIESIKQLRPLADGQPWGIFYIQFEDKRLPVGVLRRILKALIPKRQQDPSQPVWKISDLMFISSQGEPDKRSISFAHFRQQPGMLPELRTFSWDSRESHLYYIKNLNLEALQWPDDETETEAWREQWSQAFRVPHRYVPRTAQSLAEEMAKLARTIRETVLDIYGVEHVGGPLHQLHLSFRMTLINDLTPDDFADMYAQTVTYGLFSARATRSGDFAIEDVAAMIPNTNPFLRELLGQLTAQGIVDLDELGVVQLASLLKEVDMEAILQDFGRQKRGEDPVIHFYETFLGAYDPEKKAQRGVFYTPDAAVSFIVRSVDHILRTEFDCPDGLADTCTMEWKGETVPKVQILDLATGTGTFLQYVIQVIWDTFYQKHKKKGEAERKEKWNQYVSEHLLPRLYGFELMMAPYTIAHMKLGLKLKETGYEFGSDERLRVYLTNALQPAHEVPRTETPALAHEVEQANEVKTNTPINVVIGNPPYAVTSTNQGEWITNLVRGLYYPNDEIKEQNPKMLLDDYVKFIRFAQWVIEKTVQGIVAMITNHGYLNNPTFRGMRQQLMQAFDEIYVLDMHGNAKKKETAPDGSKDENVFDIHQGVAICFLIKKREKTTISKVNHADLFGPREEKYSWLMTGHREMISVSWEELTPILPFSLWIPQEAYLADEYDKYIRITKIFPINSSGLNSLHDGLVIHFDKEGLQEMILDAVNPKINDDEFRAQYQIIDSRDWKLSRSRAKAISKGKNSYFEALTRCLYRPFDKRWIVLDDDFVGYARWETTEHFLHPDSLGLATSRQSLTTISCLASNIPFAQHKIVDPYNRSYIFPLYLYPGKKATSARNLILEGFGGLGSNESRRHNLSESFVQKIEKTLKFIFQGTGYGDLVSTFGPEDIFHYMYAVFHSPTYRSRYAEFLKIDFPRLPLTSNVALFRALCGLGADLVALHLLEDDYEAASWVQMGGRPPLQHPITAFVEGINGSTMGSFTKSKVYDNGRVYLDTSLKEGSSYFDGIPEDVWNFHIGGYQVLYKWLYDRRGKKDVPGRTLTSEDIEHYQKIVVALKETMWLMAEIDEVIEAHGGWPIE